MKKKGKIKLLILICIVTMLFIGILLFVILDTKSPNYDKKFEKIQILYDYGNIMNFFGNEDEESDNMFKVDLQGEELTELKKILIDYDIESEKYRIKESGHHSWGEKHSSGVSMVPSEYKVNFYDGSEMAINESNYEILYRNRKKYYLIPDGKEISKKVIKIVDEKLHKESMEAETKLISIKGLTSGRTLNIGKQEIILKILNEFRYVKDGTITKESYDKLIDNEDNNYRELEYKIDFNNGTIIKVNLADGKVGCISDINNNFIEGIRINRKFVYMVHNIFTDYFRGTNRVFEVNEIDLKYSNKQRTLTDSEKTEFLSKLLRVEIDRDKPDSSSYSSTQGYTLKINNNKIILEEKFGDVYLYIVYANGYSSRIYSIDFVDYIESLMK